MKPVQTEAEALASRVRDSRMVIEYDLFMIYYDGKHIIFSYF